MVIEVDKSRVVLPNYKGRLLEGVSYNKSNDSWLWVDIILGEVHRYFETTGVHQILQVGPGDSVGTIGLTKNDDKIICCTKSGVKVGDFETQKVEALVEYPHGPHAPHLRSNDGKIDPHGNMIVGTMSDFGQPLTSDGSVYKLTPTLELLVLMSGTTIANGLGWNSTLTKFYWTDSPTKCVYSFDYDAPTGHFSNKQTFFSTEKLFGPDTEFVPDGMCITDKDEIFVSLFGPGLVIHLDQSGAVKQQYKFPASLITCCTVGGNDELFVSTALKAHDDMHKSIEDLANLAGGDMGGHCLRLR